jgi:predicted dehydrogenase
MAGVYATSIERTEGATVTAVASPNSAEEFVRETVPSATAYADYAELFNDEPLDAVAVLTPTHTHSDVVTAAADRGLDVICEKPLARTMDGARAIRDAVERSGITFMTAHVIRFFPAYAEAKERVDAGDVGTPGVARTKRAFGFEGGRGWFDDDARSGGVLLDLAVHDFDYLRWLLGDVERVFTRRTGWDRDGSSDVSLSVVRFESGAVGHVEAWWVEVPTVPFTEALEIAGDDGHLEYDVDEVQPLRQFGHDGVESPRDPVGDDLPLARDGYDRQLERFVDCVREGQEPPVTVEDGLQSMAVSLAAIESADRGVPVSPGEVRR